MVSDIPGLGVGVKISTQTATVYYSPSAKRRYLTKRGAIAAEARAMIAKKYPTEFEERDERARVTHPGWHWSLLPHAEDLYQRLCRLLSKQSKANQPNKDCL